MIEFIKKNYWMLVAAVFFLSACSKDDNTQHLVVAEWYSGSSVVAPDGTVIKEALNPDKIDLLYLVSTNVVEAKDAQGNTSYLSLLTADDRSATDKELSYIQNQIVKDDFNYLAPYYHQFTFEAIAKNAETLQEAHDQVYREVQGIFNYYMEYINQGRRFALVGFSQGAMLVVDLLKHSSKEQLANMVGAYLIGYGLSKDDLTCEQIIPATGAEGFGHTVSFNSVLSKQGTWPFAYNNAAVTINPVNWKTDATPASFVYKGETLSVAIDPAIHELVVSVPDATFYHDYMKKRPVYQMVHVPEDCLHHWDMQFYAPMIHDNILHRGQSR